MYKRYILFLITITAPVFAIEQVSLCAPDFSKSQFTGYAVGIRPARKGNFRLEVQTFGTKTLIHNYGHGGSGISLSWGCAEVISELMDNAYQNEKPSIAILGCGVIGLTTAFELLDKGYPVTIYASDFPPNTTSNIGAGLWDPFLLADKNEFIRQVGARAFNRFKSQAEEDFPEVKGVSHIDVYSFERSEQRRRLSPLLNPVDVEVTFDHTITHRGVRWHTLRIDGDLFLADLLEKVVLKGATCVQRTFDTKDAILTLDKDVIINCLGYGAKKVFQDPLLLPIRGQLLYFAPQSNIDYVFGYGTDSDNRHFFFIPWENRLIVGGTYEKGEEECTFSREAYHRIWENALNFFSHSPSLTAD